MFLVLRWFLFSLVAPGVGFWRAGKPHLAIAASLSLLPMPVAALAYSVSPQKLVWLFVFAALVFCAAMLVQAATGAMAARKPEVSWRSALVFALAVIMLNQLGGMALSARLAPFNTPSQSMSPTLIQGDQFYVLSDRDRYPIERGAVVVYLHPQRQVNFVKRVVGLGGDVIEWDGETLTLNGTPLPKGACEADAPAGCHTEQYGPHRWRVTTPGSAPQAGRWEVPAGHVFTLGDARGDSLDSRSDGAVPLEDVKGVARVIHFSWPTLTRTGRPLDLSP